jgi:hypothetical protein
VDFYRVLNDAHVKLLDINLAEHAQRRRLDATPAKAAGLSPLVSTSGTPGTSRSTLAV